MLTILLVNYTPQKVAKTTTCNLCSLVLTDQDFAALCNEYSNGVPLSLPYGTVYAFTIYEPGLVLKRSIRDNVPRITVQCLKVEVECSYIGLSEGVTL